MAAAQEESKSFSHPPYSEMIMTAISELGEKEGSSKQEISKQIEAVYEDGLQSDHSSQLSETLTKLKESGKLLLVNNSNYLIPDFNPQQKRGRGRPPKLKPNLAEGVEPPLHAKQKEPTFSTGKKRGRPAKNPKIGGDSASMPAVAAGQKRGRGRPPKVSLSTDASVE